MELTVTNRSRAYPGRSSGDSKVDDVQYVVLKVCYLCTSGSVVEYRLAKARVAGSNPVSCFFCCLFTHLTYIQIKILKTEMLHYYSTATSPFFHLPIISYLVNEMINF